MFEKILVPLDGSELAEGALPYVEEIARSFSSEVILLTAYLSGERVEHLLGAYMAKKVQDLQTLGVKARSVILQGDAATQILDFAKKNKIGLIIISTHGCSGCGRWPLGNIANKVMRESLIPTILVRSDQLGDVGADKELKKILVSLDGSRFAEVVIPHVEGLAKKMNSEVVLVMAIEAVKLPYIAAYRDREEMEKNYTTKAKREAERYLNKKEMSLSNKGLKVSSVPLEGKPTPTILQYGEDNSFNLIALTTHGFSGVTKWAYGSVASHIIESSSKPLLVLRASLPGLKPDDRY